MLGKGLLLAIFSIIAGFTLEGGNLLILFQPFGFIIICGVAMGAFIISTPRDLLVDVWQSMAELKKVRPYDKQDYLELLAFIFNFLRTHKQSSVTEVERQIDDPHNGLIFKRFPGVLANKEVTVFFCDQVRMLTLGLDNVYAFENNMDNAIAAKRTKIEETSHAIYKLGDSLPAIGIIAAVLGVINAMGSIASEPEILGKKIAAALIGTMLGIFFAYCLVIPISSYIYKFGQDKLHFFSCIKVALIAYCQENSAIICVEMARHNIPENYRPNFMEIEKLLSNQTKNIIIPYNYVRKAKK